MAGCIVLAKEEKSFVGVSTNKYWMSIKWAGSLADNSRKWDNGKMLPMIVSLETFYSIMRGRSRIDSFRCPIVDHCT